jgi:hypothetical protein
MRQDELQPASDKAGQQRERYEMERKRCVDDERSKGAGTGDSFC